MKKDEAKVLGKAMLIIAWINFLVSVINIFINSAALRGSIWGVNIVLMTLCLVRLWVIEHNYKAEIKELNKIAGFREGFDWATRWQLKTKVKGCEISTVDLGLDHSFGIGAPLYYETMIFGDDKFEGYQERYSTKKEAKKGHKEAIKYVKEKLKEEQWEQEAQQNL